MSYAIIWSFDDFLKCTRVSSPKAEFYALNMFLVPFLVVKGVLGAVCGYTVFDIICGVTL